MKKFLTVLLVVAVMFTFSFGSAFAALPSVEADTEYAGVADAQKDALSTVKNYAKLSKYTAKGQAEITLALEDEGGYIDRIEAADSISEVKGIVEEYKEFIDEDMAVYLVSKASVKEAGETALEQIADYEYLFGLLQIGTLDDMKEALEGEAYYDFVNVETTAMNTINAAAYESIGTVAEVEAALDAYLQALNAVLEAEMEEGAGIPQETIDALVELVEAAADSYRVNDEEHSAAVIKAYEAAIKAGVKEAKAVKTWEEVYAVVAKYLGVEETAIFAVEDEVIIVREAVGEFEKLANKTMNMEVVMDAAEKVLAELGAYKYSDVAEGSWEAAEEAREALADLIEDGECDADALGVYAAIAGLTTDSDKGDINDAVDAAVEAYEAVLRLTAEKDAAEAEIEAIADEAKAEGTYENEGKEIDTLVKQAKTEIKAAKTVKAVSEIVDEYEELIDAIPTEEEVEAAENVKKFNKDVDEKLADAIEEAKEADKKFSISADEQIQLDRLVAEMKEANEELDTPAAEADAAAVAALLEDLEFDPATDIEDIVIEKEYSAKNENLIANELIDFEEAVEDVETWKEYYAAVDAAEKAIAKYATAAQEAYIEAAKDATAALKALGAPADTRAYEKAYEKAEEAMADYADAKEALDPEDDADKAVLDANKVDEQKWADAQYEQAYFEYVSDLPADEAETEVVAEFNTIADGILELGAYYDDAAENKIAKIISDAYAAIRKAETAAAKDAVAEKAIADLDAVAVTVEADEDYAEALEDCKADAAAYFELYYGAEFASDAAKHIELAQDIIDMQEDFATVATQIEAVESLKITAGSSAKKGAITVKWSVEGETAYIDGYQVWKSTKKNSGFKKITAKTTKTQITNKKGLEAGTRYYYKVRAFQVIDGKYYYSDWSNKAYRKAK